jgi:hypothetical protein
MLRKLQFLFFLALCVTLVACSDDDDGGSGGGTDGGQVADTGSDAGQDTPAEDTPAEDTPVADTPAEDTPAQDTPAEDTPAEDTGGEDAGNPCDGACALLWTCTQEDDPENPGTKICPLLDPENEEAFTEGCLANPQCSLIGTLLGDGSPAACASGIGTISGISPEFADSCRE